MNFDITSKKYGLHTVIVDDKDAPIMRAHSWCICYVKDYKKGVMRGPYVVRRNRPHNNLYLHRILAQPGEGMVDHVNRNTLDNRRCNLRRATRSQNGANRTLQSNNKSGYIGVFWRNGHWCASVGSRKHKVNLGAFSCKIDAANARDDAAIERYGEFAGLNFPFVYS